MAKKNRVRKLKTSSGRTMDFTSRLNANNEEYEASKESLEEVRHIIRQEFSRMSAIHQDTFNPFNSIEHVTRRKHK